MGRRNRNQPSRADRARQVWTAANAIPQQAAGNLAVSLAAKAAAQEHEVEQFGPALTQASEAAAARLEQNGFPDMRWILVPVHVPKGGRFRLERPTYRYEPCWRVYTTVSTPEPKEERDAQGRKFLVESGRQSLVLLADGSLYAGFWDNEPRRSYGHPDPGSFISEQRLDPREIVTQLEIPLSELIDNLNRLH